MNVLMLCAALAAAGAPSPPLDSCWRRINIYTLGADEAARAVLNAFKTSGVLDCECDFWLFTTQVNGYCHHPTRVGVTSPGIVHTDPVGEMAAEVRRRHPGARMVAYMHPRTTYALREHPQWRALRLAGDRPLDADGTIACLGSGFLEGCLKPYLRELLAQYDFDGFWFDGTVPSPDECGCEACRRAFQAETGLAFPVAADRQALRANYRRWLRWRTAVLGRQIDELTRFVQTIKPNCTVQLLLGAGREWLGAEQLSSSEPNFRSASETCLEYFWHVDEPGDPLYAPFLAQLSRGLSGRVAEGWFPPTCHGVDDVGVPPAELQARVWTLLNCGVVPQLPVGSWQRTADLQQVFREIKAHEAYLRGAVSLKHIGLVIPANSPATLPDAAARAGQAPESLGVYRMLVEEHLPLDVLGELNLERDDLSGYRALVLPEHLALSDTAAARLRAFVADGGGLVCTGRPGLVGPDGAPRPDFALADLLGASFVGYSETRNLFGAHWGLKLPASYCPEDALLHRSATDATFGMGSGRTPGGVSCWANVVATRATTAQELLTATLKGKEPQAQPFLLRHSFGRGRVSYFAARLGQAYDKYSYPYLRRLLADEVSWAAGGPPAVSVGAPLSVMATYWTQTLPDGRSRLVIHLLNETAGQGRARLGRGGWPLREEVVKLTGVRIWLGERFAALRPVAQPEGAPLTRAADGAWELPALGLHQTIVAEE